MLNLYHHIMQYIFFFTFRIMEDSSSKCSVGLIKDDICHKLTQVKLIGLINFKDLKRFEKEIILKRSGIQQEIETICYHHKYLLLVRYESFQTTCCDPFQIHKKPVKGIYCCIQHILVYVNDLIGSAYFKTKHFFCYRFTTYYHKRIIKYAKIDAN